MSKEPKGRAPRLGDGFLDKRPWVLIPSTTGDNFGLLPSNFGRPVLLPIPLVFIFSFLQERGGPEALPSCRLPAEGVILEFPFGSSPFRPACTPIHCRRTSHCSTVPALVLVPPLPLVPVPSWNALSPCWVMTQACKPSPAGPERRSRLLARQALSASC